ncbi:RAD50-interacting protein 1 [Cydia strobilella]|uniref:RAD50-interacting protein 1 n=1 Tax=Cydia strobilella TaxID=1100964 RepID=UPI0030065C5C
MNEEDKQALIQRFNIKIGDDINNLTNAYELENEYVEKRDKLQNSLQAENNEVPTKVKSSIDKAKKKPAQIAELKEKNEKLQDKLDQFLVKTEPLRDELNKRFAAINKLVKVQSYLKTYIEVEDLCRQLSNCNEDEQSVLLFGALKELCLQYQDDHRGTYFKEYTHYWHNILKDKLTKQYEDVLKLLKWPVVMRPDMSPLPKDVMVKFHNLTKFLFLIEEPDDEQARIQSGDFSLADNPCLPVKVLVRPLKKRFTFHFTGSRQTARIDRPEWFLTQTLTWIKDHQGFVRTHVQPVADKLQLRHVRAVDEFNAGLISFAAERLHTVLGMYNAHGVKEKRADMDAAFAHAVDEALGFHRELVLITGHEVNSVLSVLTKAEIFVRWLSVEKKYALSKMDETIDTESWIEPVAGGMGSAVGSVLWVPRGADWFMSLLKTIEDRYAVLPQPGHRLQFLELQLELVEEWRVRLTQLLTAALGVQPPAACPAGAGPDPVTAVVNAAHHARTGLLQWAHCLHYLQLHYYRRQFQHFTQQQHHDESESASSSDEESDESDADGDDEKEKTDDDALSLKDVEQKAKNQAIDEVMRRNSVLPELSRFDITSPIANLSVTEPLSNDDSEEAGVFAEAPALLARLRDAGLTALADHALLEFRAAMRDYRRQKWHAMLVVEEIALCVSSPLCAPLSALCTRMNNATAKLAPVLAVRFRSFLAESVDQYIFEEVVLESWFNTGGTIQFTHDVKRNLVPAFAPPNKSASQTNLLPKLLESCVLLNMEYDEARRLRSLVRAHPGTGADALRMRGVRHVAPPHALRVLDQRTDLGDVPERSVMDLF